MRGKRGQRLLAYLVAPLSVGLAVFATRQIVALEDHFNFALFHAAVIITTWYGGLVPGLLAVVLATLTINYLFVPPYFSLAVDVTGLIQLSVFLLVALLISRFSATRRQAEAVAHQQLEQFKITLASISDAVITTDTQGHVTFMNGVAQSLTGWSQAEATGKPLAEVFRIVDELTRQPLESPVTKVLRASTEVNLANYPILLAKDGREIPIDDSGAPIRDETGQISGVVLFFRDMTVRRQAEQITKRMASLQQVTAALSQALTPAQVAEVAVTQGLPALGAIAGSIALLSSGRNEFEIISSVGLPSELLETWHHFPTTAPLPMADAVRLNKPLFLTIHEVTALLNPDLFSSNPPPRQIWAIMPLTLDNRALGVMTLHFPEGHDFNQENRDLMLTFAQQCTQAIERAQLYQAEQQARSRAEAVQERLARMQEVIAELGQALTPLQIAQVMINQGLPLVGANAGLIALPVNGESAFEIISYVGYAPEKIEPWRRFPATPGLPISDVVRRRQPLFLDSKKTAELLYPALAAQNNLDYDASAVIPLLGESQALGTMILSFPEAQEFTLEERNFMLTLGQQCAQALERAQLYLELEQRVQERTAELQAANQKLEAEIAERRQLATELVEVHRRLMESREEERVRLAQDLHDGPVQELYSVGYWLTALKEALPDETSRIELAKTQTTVQRVISTLRTTFTELRPPVLASFGLERAIHAHAKEFRVAHAELEMELELQPDDQELPEGTRLALFRIYQAALSNIVRHAQARHVSIRFSLSEKEITLEVKDDGQGFKVPQRWVELARQGHLGLVGMSERAEAIGGRLQVISAPGAGTLIRVIVPRLNG